MNERQTVFFTEWFTSAFKVLQHVHDSQQKKLLFHEPRRANPQQSIKKVPEIRSVGWCHQVIIDF